MWKWSFSIQDVLLDTSRPRCYITIKAGSCHSNSCRDSIQQEIETGNTVQECNEKDTGNKARETWMFSGREVPALCALLLFSTPVAREHGRIIFIDRLLLSRHWEQLHFSCRKSHLSNNRANRPWGLIADSLHTPTRSSCPPCSSTRHKPYRGYERPFCYGTVWILFTYLWSTDYRILWGSVFPPLWPWYWPRLKNLTKFK